MAATRHQTQWFTNLEKLIKDTIRSQVCQINNHTHILRHGCAATYTAALSLTTCDSHTSRGQPWLGACGSPPHQEHEHCTGHMTSCPLQRSNGPTIVLFPRGSSNSRELEYSHSSTEYCGEYIMLPMARASHTPASYPRPSSVCRANKAYNYAMVNKHGK